MCTILPNLKASMNSISILNTYLTLTWNIKLAELCTTLFDSFIIHCCLFILGLLTDYILRLQHLAVQLPDFQDDVLLYNLTVQQVKCNDNFSEQRGFYMNSTLLTLKSYGPELLYRYDKLLTLKTMYSAVLTEKENSISL